MARTFQAVNVNGWRLPGCWRRTLAHRLSTIRQCDRILVLDGGKIVEDGAYDELIAAKGLFAELVRRQTLDMAPL